MTINYLLVKCHSIGLNTCAINGANCLDTKKTITLTNGIAIDVSPVLNMIKKLVNTDG